MSRAGDGIERGVTPNYALLAAHLRSIRTLTLKMSFSEVEAITGKLPASARTFRQFWQNTQRNIQAREGWLAAGYETSSVNMAQQTLELTRSAWFS